jgi:hypothetical protein
MYNLAFEIYVNIKRSLNRLSTCNRYRKAFARTMINVRKKHLRLYRQLFQVFYKVSLHDP